MKYLAITCGVFTAILWYLVLSYNGIVTPLPLFYLAWVLLFLTPILAIAALLEELVVEVAKDAGKVGEEAHEYYSQLPPEEQEYWKQKVKSTASKAEMNYQAYKSGEKGKVSAIIDTIL